MSRTVEKVESRELKNVCVTLAGSCNPYSESTNAPDKGTNLKNVTETIDHIKDHLETWLYQVPYTESQLVMCTARPDSLESPSRRFRPWI